MSHHDCQCYYLRTGDTWTNIDYTKKAEEWMKPLVKGQETGLVEIPASWYLDDLPPMLFIKGAPNSHGFVNPRDIEELWRDQFDYCYREYDEFIFPITVHPDVSGRPQVLLMHERYDLPNTPRALRQKRRGGHITGEGLANAWWAGYEDSSSISRSTTAWSSSPWRRWRQSSSRRTLRRQEQLCQRHPVQCSTKG